MSLLLTVNIVNNKNNFVLIIYFEQTNICWVHIEKSNTFEDKIEFIMCYVVIFFKYEQNLLTNIIWTYTITTLQLNEWEIFAKEFTSDVDSG